MESRRARSRTKDSFTDRQTLSSSATASPASRPSTWTTFLTRVSIVMRNAIGKARARSVPPELSGARIDSSFQQEEPVPRESSDAQTGLARNTIPAERNLAPRILSKTTERAEIRCRASLRYSECLFFRPRSAIFDTGQDIRFATRPPFHHPSVRHKHCFIIRRRMLNWATHAISQKSKEVVMNLRRWTGLALVGAGIMVGVVCGRAMREPTASAQSSSKALPLELWPSETFSFQVPRIWLPMRCG